MTPKIRKTYWYEVTVLDESAQSLRIIDVPGYSHMSTPKTAYLAGKNYPVRDAYIRGYNKSEVTKLVKYHLGGAYWSSLNGVARRA